MPGSGICLKSGDGPHVPSEKRRLPLLLGSIPSFSRIGRIGTRPSPPFAASRSRGSLHSGNASSPNGGNSSPKEALLARARIHSRRDSFCAWLRQWLNTIERDSGALRSSEGALACLSLDLEGGTWLSRASPKLARLLAYNRTNDPSLGASRRKWLKRLGVCVLVPELLVFWRRNVQRLVPNPAASRGDYDSCADWVQATRQSNPTSLKQLLREWSVCHHRRRNLWRALEAKGLSKRA